MEDIEIGGAPLRTGGEQEAQTKAGLFNAPLRQKLKDALLRRILSGSYKPGERLTELRIAEEFGTSQGPVREALRDLESTGLVVTRPRRGSYVAEGLRKGLREIYAVRGALEEQATRLATANGRCDLQALQEATDAMREAALRFDLAAIADHSVAFHRAILEAAGNQLLTNIWLSLHIETRTTITLLAEGIDLMHIAESHQPIIDAIASGDAERAAKVAREHQDYFERLPTPA
ncbi:GntR family transcriptional regulator [Aestuariivirga sp.]|uniref:GntR family transcriptional regulator n=1 Tax=Aestuariivirga sp. TaxID=2650926 RepID=UPI003BA8F467